MPYLFSLFLLFLMPGLCAYCAEDPLPLEKSTLGLCSSSPLFSTVCLPAFSELFLLDSPPGGFVRRNNIELRKFNFRYPLCVSSPRRRIVDFTRVVEKNQQHHVSPFLILLFWSACSQGLYLPEPFYSTFSRDPKSDGINGSLCNSRYFPNRM